MLITGLATQGCELVCGYGCAWCTMDWHSIPAPCPVFPCTNYCRWMNVELLGRVFVGRWITEERVATEAHRAGSLICEKHGGLWESERSVPPFLQPQSSSQVKPISLLMHVINAGVNILHTIFHFQTFICPFTRPIRFIPSAGCVCRLGCLWVISCRWMCCFTTGPRLLKKTASSTETPCMCKAYLTGRRRTSGPTARLCR